MTPGLNNCPNCRVFVAVGPKCAKCDCYDSPTCRHRAVNEYSVKLDQDSE